MTYRQVMGTRGYGYSGVRWHHGDAVVSAKRWQLPPQSHRPMATAQEVTMSGSLSPEPHRVGSAGRDSPDADALERPTDLPAPSMKAVVRRALREFQRDQLTDLAAALTYYGVLAIVPGLIVVISLVGLLGPQATSQVVSQVSAIAPGSSAQFVHTLVTQAQSDRTGAGVGAILGLLVAVWSASGYVAAFMRASNRVYDIGEGRPVWQTIPVRIGVTVVAMVILVLSTAIALVSGPVARQTGGLLGLGDVAVTAYSIVKWPVLVLLLSVLLAILFWASPNARQGGVAWVSPGGLVAVLLWAVVSAIFAVYVANFSSYDKTYGSLAGVVIFLVWLWLSNLALLLGAEINAELDHARAIAAGLPEDEETFAVPRDTRKLDEDERRAVERAMRQRGSDMPS